MEQRTDKIPAFFRKYTNYGWIMLTVFAAAALIALVVLAVMNITGHFNPKAPLFVVAAGLYLEALILLAALVFSKDWREPKWVTAIKIRPAGTEPTRAETIFTSVIFIVFFAAVATGLLIHALSL